MPASWLQRTSLALLTTTDCPTASVRRLAARSDAVPTPISLLAFTWMKTGRSGSQAHPPAGSVMLSCVVVAAVIVAGTPSTSTALPATVGAKLVPVMTAAPPAASAVTAVILGALAEPLVPTRTRMVAVTPSPLPDTTAVPAASAVTTPSCVTDATLGASTLKKSVGFTMARPAASAATGTSVSLPPGRVSTDESRSKVSVATTCRMTWIVTPALLPPAAPRTVPWPGCRPVTTPSLLTLSMAGVTELHWTGACGMISPSLSNAVAVTRVV